MRCDSKTKLNQLLKIEGDNPFEDLLITMQFSRAVLSKDLRILDTFNKGPEWEFLLSKDIILRGCFLH